jgi:LysM repeat protein
LTGLVATIRPILPLALAAPQSYFWAMKRAFVLLSLLAVAPLARAQDSTAAWRDELTENYKSLKNTVADQKETIELQRKAIDKLQGDLSDLRKQMSKPPGNFASPDDLKVLKDALQDEAKKRQADDEKILTEITKQIGKLGKTADAGGGSVAGPDVVVGTHGGGGNPAPHTPPKTEIHTDPPAAGPGGDGPGFVYVVKSNDYPAKIARKLYEAKGIKVTPEQIMAANPGVKDTELKVDQKLFIPLPKDADPKK